MPLPDIAQKIAVNDVVQGSGSAVLPRISGTATAQARATKPTDRWARHTAAKRCLIAAERLYPGVTASSALASGANAAWQRRTVVNGHAIAVVAAIRARRTAGACGLRRSLRG